MHKYRQILLSGLVAALILSPVILNAQKPQILPPRTEEKPHRPASAGFSIHSTYKG
jgi:hypothetical protein